MNMSGGHLTRRVALKVAAGAAAGAAALGQARIGRAHELRPGDPAYRFDDYERIVNREITIRMLFQWPNLMNPILYANISNALNGFQFSYDIPAQQVQVVVQAYASSNLALYDDSIWAKYQFGDVFKVQDPATGQPATRNIWYASKNPPVSQPPAERSNPYYSDTSIEGLQRRGVLFLI